MKVKGGFARNILTLVSGTAVAQIINLAFMPIITRMYGPEAFGVLGYYSSMLTFLSPLVGLAYPLAIVLPKRRVEAKLLFEAALKLAVLITIIVSVALWVLDFFYKGFFPFSLPFILVPIGALLTFGILAYSQWAIREGRFRLISVSTVLVATLGGSGKILIGTVHPSALSLILIVILALLINLIILMFYQRVGVKLATVFGVNKAHIHLVKKYARFPFFRMPHAINAAVSQLAPVFLLTTFFGAKYAGYFVLTRMVLTAPVILVGNAVYNVSYPKINDRLNDGLENYKFISKITKQLALISLVPLLLIFFGGELLFSKIFGEQWRLAGLYAVWMAPWFALNFLNKAVVAAVSVYKLDGFLFRNGLLNVFLSLVGFSLGALIWKDDLAAVALFSIFSVVCQLILIKKVLGVVRLSDASSVKR